MQNVIVPKPYKFIPPHRGNLAPTLVQTLGLLDAYLNRVEGVHSFEVRGIEHLRESLRQRRGILLAPNHCRYADPLAMGWVARQANVHLFAMASWHLFHQQWWQSVAMRMCGGFSIYREGVDRQSLDTAIEILVAGERPLVLFPEGAVYRTNDHLQPLLDGVSFVARAAARRRHKQGLGEVVVHPVGIKYIYKGNIIDGLLPVISALESRFSQRSSDVTPHRVSWDELLFRVHRLEEGVLALKERQFLGSIQSGSRDDRRQRLIEELIGAVERKWLGGPRASDGMLNRIKLLRMKMVPHLIEAAEAPRRASPKRATTASAPAVGSPAIIGLQREIWSDLERLYCAQQVGSYPVGYLDNPTDMRLLETVERLEEEVTDRATTHRPLHVILQVDAPLTVSHQRPPRESSDPLMEGLRQRLQGMLDDLAMAARRPDCPADPARPQGERASQPQNCKADG